IGIASPRRGSRERLSRHAPVVRRRAPRSQAAAHHRCVPLLRRGAGRATHLQARKGDGAMSERPPTFYAWLSVATSIVTIVLKFPAYFLTGSIGLLSDAVEAVVNIVAALVALGVLTYAAEAPDREHNFGHEKAQYFSSGIEGALIFVAAGAIVWS